MVFLVTEDLAGVPQFPLPDLLLFTPFLPLTDQQVSLVHRNPPGATARTSASPFEWVPPVPRGPSGVSHANSLSRFW